MKTKLVKWKYNASIYRPSNLKPYTKTNTPDLFVNVLLLSCEPSVFFLLSFDCLLPNQQFTVHCSCSLLSLLQGVTKSTDALLIMVELSEAQLQVALVKFIQQCLVFLCLEIWAKMNNGNSLWGGTALWRKGLQNITNPLIYRIEKTVYWQLFSETWRSTIPDCIHGARAGWVRLNVDLVRL